MDFFTFFESGLGLVEVLVAEILVGMGAVYLRGFFVVHMLLNIYFSFFFNFCFNLNYIYKIFVLYNLIAKELLDLIGLYIIIYIKMRNSEYNFF